MPEFFRGVGAARFGVMAGVAAALTAFFLYIAGAITEPAKSILFAGLEARDAAAVTAKLDAMNVPYDAKGDGGTILVPADQVTKLRMELASENLPAAGVGYEIFDKSDAFGTTAFVQNINRLRAIEGELARSIQTIDGIAAARIHLVVPERQIFSRDEQTPSASVVIKTRGVMDREQVGAIQHLVAAAVAGLSPDHVAIIDDKGNLLAGGDDKSGTEASAAKEEESTTGFEDRLRQRIESIVTSLVGPGHVRVQVAADMTYNHVSETSETFDPDSKVVRSSQTVESDANEGTNDNNAVSVANALPNQTSTSTPGSKSTNTRNEETTNYEISKTTRTSVIDGGTVKHLSVAVAVDGDTKTNASGAVSYTARSKDELQKIEMLVKSAIGFDKARGDVVQVVNMPFARMDTGPITPVEQPLLGLESGDWLKIIEVAIMGLVALLMGFFVVRPLVNRMFTPMAAQPAYLPNAPQMAGQLAAPGQQQQMAAAEPGQAALPGPRESLIDISRIDGQVRESSIKKVGEVVQSHPDEAIAILRTWLHQPV